MTDKKFTNREIDRKHPYSLHYTKESDALFRALVAKLPDPTSDSAYAEGATHADRINYEFAHHIIKEGIAEEGWDGILIRETHSADLILIRDAMKSKLKKEVIDTLREIYKASPLAAREIDEGSPSPEL